MGSHFSVPFRGGEIDIVVTHDGGYEYDTGAWEIEWEFDHMTTAEVEALGVTDREQEMILDSIYEVLGCEIWRPHD